MKHLFKDTAIIRTLLSVPNATFVYLRAPYEDTSLSIRDNLICPNGVQIREVPRYIKVTCISAIQRLLSTQTWYLGTDESVLFMEVSLIKDYQD